MKFAVCQMDIGIGDPQGNREKVKHWARRTVKVSDPDVLVLPEMWTTAYALSELEELADRNAEPSLSFLSDLAKTHRVHVIGGSVANKRDGKFYNTALVVNREGECIYQYDKIHLVPMLDEPSYLSGGESRAEVFTIDGIKMGIIICYDLRFPELARRMALEGAQVLYVVAEWPTERKDHWKALQWARAIENQMVVVSCNRVGMTNHTTFCGTSMIIDAWGSILAKGSQDREETVTAAVDLSEVSDVRRQVPVFGGRVPELY